LLRVAKSEARRCRLVSKVTINLINSLIIDDSKNKGSYRVATDIVTVSSNAQGVGDSSIYANEASNTIRPTSKLKVISDNKVLTLGLLLLLTDFILLVNLYYKR